MSLQQHWITSNTCNAKVTLGTEETRRIIPVYKCNDEILSHIIFVINMCHVCTQIKSPTMGHVSPLFVLYLKCSVQADPSHCMPADSKQESTFSLCFPLHSPHALTATLHLILFALEWHLTFLVESVPDQSDTVTFWVISSAVSRACKGYPCLAICSSLPMLVSLASEPGTPNSASFQVSQSSVCPYSSLWSAAPLQSWSSWKCSIHSMCP